MVAQKSGWVEGAIILLGCEHSHLAMVVWGHAPPGNFRSFNSLRVFLLDSDRRFWTDLVAIFNHVHSFANTEHLEL